MIFCWISILGKLGKPWFSRRSANETRFPQFFVSDNGHHCPSSGLGELSALTAQGGARCDLFSRLIIEDDNHRDRFLSQISQVDALATRLSQEVILNNNKIKDLLLS